MFFIAVGEKALSPALAFTANRLTLFFNHIPLTVADCTNHFNLPVSRNWLAVKQGAVTVKAYMPFEKGWQEKFRPIRDASGTHGVTWKKGPGQGKEPIARICELG